MDDVGGADRSVRSVVPTDVERLESLFRRPHVIGHHRDRVVEDDDLADPFDRLCLAVVDADQLATDHGTRGDGGDLHSRQLDVDAELRGPIHLPGGIEALGRRADQLEVLRVPERDLRWDRQLRGPVRQYAVGELAAGGRVRDDSSPRLARSLIDLPRLGCRGHEHRPRGRAGAAQRLVERAHGRRGARLLIAEEFVRVEVVVGRRVLDLDLIQSDLQLLGQEHRHRRVRALPHFDLTDDQGDPAIPADANERVRSEGSRHCFVGGCKNPRPGLAAPSDEEATTGSRTREEELATGHRAHGQPPFPAVVVFRAASLMASRMRGYVPQRQMFPDIAWSMSVSVGAGIFASSAAAAMI